VRPSNRYKEIGYALLLLSRIMREQNDLEGARRAVEELLAQGVRTGDADLTGLAHEGIGTLSVRQGRLPQAIDHFREYCQIAEKQGSKLYMSYCLANPSLRR
jgi:hypothetical protein